MEREREIAERLARLREAIARWEEKAGRSPGEVKLVLATKYAGVEELRAALAAGERCFGESRVQDLVRKVREIGQEEAEWHFIGRLQTNKIAKAIPLIRLLQSLDREGLARELSRYLERREPGRVLDCLVEVNVSGGEAKTGVPPDEEAVARFCSWAASLPGIRVKGLMALGPHPASEAEIRRAFRRMRQIFEALAQMRLPGVEMRHLSLGMSGDFHLAILEGANMVRIGSAVFRGGEIPFP